MIELTRIRVYGTPEVFPKPELVVFNGVPRSIDRDYRTRRNPVTGGTEKYDRGYKRRWMDHVAKTVLAFMARTSMDPFSMNHPIAMGCLFYMVKSKSCKLPMPSQKPDMDNMSYAIYNALGRTPEKKGRPGKYPEGVLYYDDNQVVWQLQPSGMVWATEQEPPGVLISICDALDIREEIESLSNTRESRLI